MCRSAPPDEHTAGLFSETALNFPTGWICCVVIKLFLVVRRHVYVRLFTQYIANRMLGRPNQPPKFRMIYSSCRSGALFAEAN